MGEGRQAHTNASTVERTTVHGTCDDGDDTMLHGLDCVDAAVGA